MLALKIVRIGLAVLFSCLGVGSSFASRAKMKFVGQSTPIPGTKVVLQGIDFAEVVQNLKDFGARMESDFRNLNRLGAVGYFVSALTCNVAAVLV